MVQVRYLGITNPKEAFDALRPFNKALIDLQCRCRPFGTDYLVLAAAHKALTTAAFHFTGDSTFYSSKSPG